MTNEKTFTVVGTAKNADGTVKARFANDLVSRIKILNKAGCTDINLQELPQAMTKLEALQFLTAQGVAGDAGGRLAASSSSASAQARRRAGIRGASALAPRRRQEEKSRRGSHELGVGFHI